IFLIIRFTSIKIPIRPFFITTSVLMALLVIIFAGGGVHALIEGELLSGMYVAGVPTNDWLGLYPYAETLIAQAVAIVAVLVLGIIAVYKQHALNNKKPE
ncbi:MAG: iron permease, partial [Bifidobacteriaceae bacterium]|nr:iron permease [Bifidobacteriaceae bacterium]